MRFSTRYRFRSLVAAAAVLATFMTTTQAPAQAIAEARGITEASSLKFVPGDAAFYISMMRLRERFDAVASSKAYAKVMSLPFVQQGVGQLMSQWENPGDPGMASFKAFMSMPENKELVSVLKDAVSNEVFFYGDRSFVDLIGLFIELNRSMNGIQFEAISSGKEPGEIMPQKMLEALVNSADQLRIPNVIKGFRLTNAEAAKRQLQRLEAIGNMVLAQQPQFKDRFGRQELGEGEYLSIKLDGSMVPWDQIPMDDLDEANIDRSEVEKLIAKLRQMTLTISIGLRGDYLVLALGDSTDALASLGSGNLLANRRELQPLAKHADKPITSVAYVSEEFMQGIASPDRQLDDAVQMLKGALGVAPIDPQMKSQLDSDIDEFFDDVREFVVKPGAVLGFEWSHTEGFESYSYNWGENPYLDGTKPLSILDHVGGDPLFFYAGRRKYSPEGYQFMSKWLKKGFGYGETIARNQLQGEELEFFEKVRQDMLPLVARLDKTNREKLIPGFDDGQFALLLDAKTTSKQWHAMLPTSEEMPMLEAAIAYGVSDSELIKEGARECFDIAREVIRKVHEIAPDKVPEFDLPEPQSREFPPSGKVYYYTLGQQLMLDKKIAPNIAISDDVVIASLLPRATVRFLKKSPVQLNAPLDDASQPRMAAIHFNFAGLLDAIKPWADFAMAMQGLGGDDINSKMIREHVDVAVEVLKCFRGVTSSMYREDGAVVSHTMSRFQDLN